MATSNLKDEQMLYQTVPREISRKVNKFGGFSFLIKKSYINVQSQSGTIGSLPPGLNRVKEFYFEKSPYCIKYNFTFAILTVTLRKSSKVNWSNKK